MASTFSSLKIELIGAGDQIGTWGGTTNLNLGTALEQAIVGKATLVTGDFTSNVYTMPYNDSNAAQNFRALVLDIQATLSAAGTINVPAISKPYIVLNNSVGGYAVTVKVSGQTGVSVPNGAKVLLYNNGTDVGPAVTYLTSLTLGSALPVSSGGTGQTSYTDGQLLIGNSTGNTLTKTTLTAGSNISVTNGAGSITVSLVPNPALGTPSSGTLTNCTGLPLTTGVTGTLPVVNGGTGITAFGTGVATALGQNVSGSGSIALTTSPSFTTPVLGTPTSGTLTNCTGLPVSTGVFGLGTNVAAALGINVGSSGAFVVNGGALGTPSSGTLTNCTGLPLSTGVSGTLSISNGGTGQTTYTDGQLLIGNSSTGGLSKATLTAGSNIAITNSNGGITIESTPFSGTLAVANGGTGQTTYTNGQLLIGNTTGNTLTKATLTAGTNVSITNGTGSITIAAGVGSGSNAVAIGPSATAQGPFTVAIGLSANTAPSHSNSIAMGNAASTGNASCISIGGSASTTQFSSIAIGASTSVSASYGIAIGDSATASGANSLSVRLGSTNSIVGYYAFGHASGTAGRYQRTELMLQQTTTSTATTRLTSDGAAAAATNQLTLRNNSAFRPGQIDIVAYDTVAGTAAAFTITGVLIKRGANAASTALVGTPTVTQVQNDMAVAPTVTVTADTTNGALAISVASGSSNSTRYTAIIRTCEVASA